MGKYVFIIVLIFLAVCAVDFFGIYDVPWLEVPKFGADKRKEGTERIKNSINEQTDYEKDKK